MSQSLMHVQQLCRHYGSTVVVNDISFTLQKGEILALLGPNGAGKSTTMQMLCGTLAPSSGHIEIAGFDLLKYPKQAKAQLGYLAQTPPLYDAFGVQEYLTFCAKIRHVRRSDLDSSVQTVMSRCGLQSIKQRKLGNLSTGYRQRVGIAQAIVHRPRVIVLDEPANGLDPQQIAHVRGLLQSLKEDHCILISCHILSEVAATCDRVLMMHQGRRVFYDAMTNLQAHLEHTTLSVVFESPPQAAQLMQIPGIESVQVKTQTAFLLQTKQPKTTAQSLIEQSRQQGWGLYQIGPEAQALERLFHHYIDSAEKAME